MLLVSGCCLGGTLADGVTRLDSVLEFDLASQEWRQVGVLRVARGAHAASIVRVQDIQDYCT